MFYSDGAIIAQIQDIVKEEFERSVHKYQLLENGNYSRFVGLKQSQRRIDIETEIMIALKCADIFCAVRLYTRCPVCYGDRYNWDGYESYRCPKCNIRGEVEA